MAEDEYTLMSSKDVSELKQDVDYLKKNPLGGLKSGKSLQDSIDKLNENISELVEIFKEASDMMKAEEREADIIVKKIEPIEKRLEELSDQNQKIAKGILAVADMVGAKEQPKPRPALQVPRPGIPRPMAPKPMMPPMGAPPKPMPSMGGMPPPPQGPPGLPPLTPPKKEEKKGILSLFKKK